ncbi:MAG: prepilin-type N-terminal cleavage/methylation domain-containing protein [Armatimonadetes bacterium]|jgi:prepilin-type N-terminal cleavage/methylation domain-containing protein/prepilin-type processing-associated H-X9-DG protein|nr:prepilin-type N-terminal cleavage/methylation domain-containing protein [Armatimonadota bacterium]
MLSLSAVPKRHVQKSFTLIELLVVIAIIAILAAILFPVFAQARDKARSAACLSNTKQLSLGVMMYAQDYDETLPVIGYNQMCRGRWQWQIYPYVKNEKVFTCPNINQPWRAVTFAYTGIGNSGCPGATVMVGADNNGGYGWSYGLSHAYENNGAGPPNAYTAPGLSMAQIAKPAETLCIGETGYPNQDGTPNGTGWGMWVTDPRSTIPAGTNAAGLIPQFRHNATQFRTDNPAGLKIATEGRANFAFLDGHSKNLSVGAAFQLAPQVGGQYVEDGEVLLNPAGYSGSNPSHHAPWVLWNTY